MKSILYVGATLMIGASIYGFADYRKTSQKQEFAGMYETTEVNVPVTEEKPSIVVEKKEVVQANRVIKKAAAEKAIVVETKSNIATEPVEKIPSEIVTVSTPTIKETVPVEKIKKAKKRKLSTKSFSRAAMRDDDPPKVLKTDESLKVVTKQ